MAAVKVSISLDERDLRDIKRAARKRKTTVSAVLQEAWAHQKRLEAMDRVIARMGGPWELTSRDNEEIDREWGRH
jgi:hypothetical protein